MSPAHPETMARTHIYQACLPRKKAIQQPMLGIFVQIKATRSIGGRVTMLPVETSGTQSGSDPQSGDSSQVEPGRTRNTAAGCHQRVCSAAVVGAPLGGPVFVLEVSWLSRPSMVKLAFPGFSPALASHISYQWVKVISPEFSFHPPGFHLLALTISFPFPPLHTHTCWYTVLDSPHQ